MAVEAGFGAQAGGAAHGGGPVTVAEQVRQRPGEGGLIVGGNQEAGEAIFHYFCHASDGRGHHRRAAGHGFEGGESEGLLGAGQGEDRSRGQEFRQGIAGAEEGDLLGDSCAAGGLPGGTLLGPVTHQDQARPEAGRARREGLDQPGHALDCPEVADMDDCGRSMLRRPRGGLGAALRWLGPE